MIFKNLFSKKNDIQDGNKIYAGTMTRKKIEKIIRNREKIVDDEFHRGYSLIEKYPRSVSVLGSARFDENNKYYKHAYSLAGKIVRELKYAVVTGGGPGIMEAANKGAYEAGGVSLGFTIKLKDEQGTNKYVTENVEFKYFFSRKTLLFFAAESYIYYPGGFGTLDELLEIMTLIQTKKINKAPVILVGSEFWTPILALMKQKLLVENNTINKEDLDICQIVDSEDEIVKIVKNAPYREE